jgi:glycerol-3-phosphate dehydrogenase
VKQLIILIGIDMFRNLNSLTGKNYDLIVIGGGIFGACAAWDAVQRGLSVALLEKSDFCSATSSQHFKLLHGGMRYLQHLDIGRTRSSSHEQSTFFRIAPHLTYPIPILIPTYGHGAKGKEILKAGTLLYNLLTFDRNLNIKDPNRKSPKPRFISPDEVLKIFPKLDKRNLTGGVILYEGQIYNSPRLVISFIKSAVKAGLDAANYLEVTKYAIKNKRVTGVWVKDFFTGKEFEIKSKVTLNTAGPWANRLNEKSFGSSLNLKPTFSRDLLIIVSKPLVGKYALGQTVESQDADAFIDRGGRHLFTIPWKNFSLIGVWHKTHRNGSEDIIVLEEELQRFLEEANKIYSDFNITTNDISMINTGFILFGDENSQGPDEEHSFGKRSILVDHLKDNKIEGLITLIGVRATMARHETERVIDMVFKKLGKKVPSSRTSTIPIYGGNIDNFEEFLEETRAKLKSSFEDDVIEALVHNYGSKYGRLLAYAKEDPSLCEPVGDSTVIRAEVVHAIKEEMAQKLEDVVFRRTDLGTGKYPGDKAIDDCANLMAQELNWDKDRKQKEIEEIKARFIKYHGLRDDKAKKRNMVA